VQIVQSLNSPFFPPHIGAEPGRVKEESRIIDLAAKTTTFVNKPSWERGDPGNYERNLKFAGFNELDRY